MTKFAWSTRLAVLAGIAAGIAGCTVTVNGGDGGNISVTDDSSTPDTGVSPGADAGHDAEASADGDAAPEIAIQNDGGTCATGIATGTPPCDTCLETSCCMSLDTCATVDSAGTDDAGLSGCIQYVQCVLDWVSSGSGTLSDGETTCAGSHSSSQKTEGNTFLSCLTTTCGTACPLQ